MVLTCNRVCIEISCELVFLVLSFLVSVHRFVRPWWLLCFLVWFSSLNGFLAACCFFTAFLISWFCSTRLCCLGNLYIALLILQYLALRLFISVDIFKASICHWISFMFSFEILPSLFLFCDPLDVGWFMLDLETFLHLLYWTTLTKW